MSQDVESMAISASRPALPAEIIQKILVNYLLSAITSPSDPTYRPSETCPTAGLRRLFPPNGWEDMPRQVKFKLAEIYGFRALNKQMSAHLVYVLKVVEPALVEEEEEAMLEQRRQARHYWQRFRPEVMRRSIDGSADYGLNVELTKAEHKARERFRNVRAYVMALPVLMRALEGRTEE